MHHWQLTDRVLTIDRRALVMGIVNVTPDSFSDGGKFSRFEDAVYHGVRLAEQGADILDVGGESTRPGSKPVSVDEELNRVLPVVESLVQKVSVPVSVDTSKAAVARACLQAGAHIVNDVTALTGDPEMAEVVQHFGAGAVLMHMQGTPATMQQNPHYRDVLAEVLSYLEERLRVCEQAGINGRHLAVDPGIGFGKTTEHNLELMARLGEFQRLGRPVCLGVSRKGIFGRLLGGRPVERRLAGSLAVACHAVGRGAAQIVRAHDVEETRDAVTVVAALAARVT